MEKEKTNGQILNVIPEFFFDLISRVPPGILLIFLSYQFVFPESAENKIINLGFSEMIILILFGYGVGILLSTPAKFIGTVYFKSVWEKRYEAEKSTIDEFLRKHPLDIKMADYKKFKTKQWILLYRHAHDYSKNFNKQAELMLPKLSAESSIANNTVVAIVLFLSMLSVRHFFIEHVNHYFWFLSLIVVCIGLILIGKERYDRLLGSQFAYLKIIIESK